MSPTNYEAVTERRKSRSGTRSRACPKKSDMPRKAYFENGSPEAEPAVGHVGKKQTCPVTNSTPTWRLRYLARQARS